MNKLDIIGQKYGRLTVLQEVDKIDNNRYFLCECECGTKKVVRMSHLRTGKTQSCGCYNKERITETKLNDLTGQPFGKLRVIGRSARKHPESKVFWLCICDCGKTTEVLGIYLTTGQTTSCGCLKRLKGQELQEYLETNFRVDGVITPSLTRKVRSDSTTGIKGVQHAKNGKYRASISVKGTKYYLGEYASLEQAIAARKAGEEKYHKPYLEDGDG